MHAWMHGCMHACMYACMYVCMHACMYVWDGVHTTRFLRKAVGHHAIHACIHCIGLHCIALHCNAMQCNAMQCNAMQCNAMHVCMYVPKYWTPDSGNPTWCGGLRRCVRGIGTPVLLLRFACFFDLIDCLFLDRSVWNILLRYELW